MKRADYELIAKVINENQMLTQATRSQLTVAFTERLKKNGNFDKDKFWEACGN